MFGSGRFAWHVDSGECRFSRNGFGSDIDQC